MEEHVAGQYLRLLLADGRLLSAVHAPGGPWNLGEGVRDVTGEIHADIEAFAQGAAEATPGMPVLTVDIVVNDFTGPTAHENRPVLVEHSERPWMYLQHVADERRISELGHELLQSSARHAGLTLPGSGMGTQERVTFRWEGLSQVAEDIQAAEAAAGQMQLDLRFTSTDPVAGVVCGEVSGPPAVIALLSEFVIDGHVLTAPAMAVETRPA
ncbi:hypothetical protein [Nesterenkonia sphaerica]|uniref:Uncharacterized protein n=1 Tax=Nesterenkonia sphaerica TaxID=1804988 RepID=A0A5R9AKJ0_9MICC|nr:hypothetical protein [Nesterenkonia sphaerica]TLP79322.1 hypothetical protein FEF27_01575 [Nesterenkonia sphaerica]